MTVTPSLFLAHREKRHLAPNMGRFLCLTLGLAAVSACSSEPVPTNIHAIHAQDVTTAGVVEARGNDEAEVLKRVRELKTGKPTKVGSLVVVADSPYRAASGRTCRSVIFKREGSTEGRLACTEHLIGEEPQDSPDREDTPWVFVPAVFSHPVNPSSSTAEPALSQSQNEDATAQKTPLTTKTPQDPSGEEATPEPAAPSLPEDRMP